MITNSIILHSCFSTSKTEFIWICPIQDMGGSYEIVCLIIAKLNTQKCGIRSVSQSEIFGILADKVKQLWGKRTKSI